MVTRRRIVGLIVLLTAVSVVRADIGPPRVREDVVNIRLFAGKDYSDYIFYVCRSKGTAEQINISMDKPVVLEGEKGASLSVAAVPTFTRVKSLSAPVLVRLLVSFCAVLNITRPKLTLPARTVRSVTAVAV